MANGVGVRNGRRNNNRREQCSHRGIKQWSLKREEWPTWRLVDELFHLPHCLQRKQLCWKTWLTEFAKKRKSIITTKSCNKKGIAKKNNLTKNETNNLRSLEKRVKSGEVVIMQTDKSRKLTINKPDNYMEQMKPHLRDDAHVTTDEQTLWKEHSQDMLYSGAGYLRWVGEVTTTTITINTGQEQKVHSLPRQHSHPHCMACPKITRNYKRGERTRDTQYGLFVVPLKAWMVHCPMSYQRSLPPWEMKWMKQ